MTWASQNHAVPALPSASTHTDNNSTCILCMLDVRFRRGWPKLLAVRCPSAATHSQNIGKVCGNLLGATRGSRGLGAAQSPGGGGPAAQGEMRQCRPRAEDVVDDSVWWVHAAVLAHCSIGMSYSSTGSWVARSLKCWWSVLTAGAILGSKKHACEPRSAPYWTVHCRNL